MYVPKTPTYCIHRRFSLPSLIILFWCVTVCVCVCISINAAHCKLTTRRFESKRRVVNLQCSALIEMGVVVVKWSEFCYVGYVRHSCITTINVPVL